MASISAGDSAAGLWRGRLVIDIEIDRMKIIAAGDRRTDVMYVI